MFPIGGLTPTYLTVGLGMGSCPLSKLAVKKRIVLFLNPNAVNPIAILCNPIENVWHSSC